MVRPTAREFRRAFGFAHAHQNRGESNAGRFVIGILLQRRFEVQPGDGDLILLHHPVPLSGLDVGLGWDQRVAEGADLFLIAGDLFDNNRVDDSNIEFVYDQLARVRCPVVLLPGNHDVHDDRSVWNRFDFEACGDHVHGLMTPGGGTVVLPQMRALVWGKAMEEHAPENLPLEGVPDRRDDWWNIGMAHGQVCERRIGWGSSPITCDEIRLSGLDYLALGHVHVHADHSEGDTVAHYCGSPVAHYAGSEGGKVALVTLCPDSGVNVAYRQISQWGERDAPSPHGAFNMAAGVPF